MNKTNKAIKWIPGFFVFVSIALMVRQFAALEVPAFWFFMMALGIYTGIGVMLIYRKWTARVALFALAVVVFIVSLDFVVSWISLYFGDEAMLSNINEVIKSYNGSDTRHSLSWLHRARDFFDFERIAHYIFWMVNERIADQMMYSREIASHGLYEKVFSSLLLVITAGMAYGIFQSKWLKIFLLAPLVVFVASWYSFVELPHVIYMLYFLGMLGYIVVEKHYKLIENNGDYKTTYVSAKGILTWSLTMGVVLVLSTSILQGVLPVDAFNRAIDGVIPNLWGVRSGYDTSGLGIFSLRETPFQNDEGYLGGPVPPINYNRVLFEVTLNEPVSRPVYFKSNTRDFYTGRRWISQTDIFRNEFSFYLDDPRHEAIIEEGSPGMISGEVVFDQMKTITLFTPMGFYETDINPSRVYVSIENEAFYKGGAFVRFLQTYTFKSTGRDFIKSEELDYLQINEGLSSDVKELALYLGSFGDSDADKMNILTQFLVQNYDYNLSVPSQQVRSDFVSNFLLEMNEGYCTYFASALTMMARVNGIPTRYVEGFVVSHHNIEGPGIPFSVTDGEAHAWTEAYIEGEGWVIFEPTPPYNIPPENISEDVIGFPEEDTQAGDNGQTGDRENQGNNAGDFEINIDDYLMESDGGRASVSDREDEGEETLPEDEADQTTRRKWLQTLLFFGVIVLVSLILLKLPIFHMMKAYTPQQAIRALYYLAHIISETHHQKHPDLEVRFKSANLPDATIKKWMRLLYDRPDRLDDDVLKECVDEIYLQIDRETYRYKKQRGWPAYLKLRFVTIKKIAP